MWSIRESSSKCYRLLKKKQENIQNSQTNKQGIVKSKYDNTIPWSVSLNCIKIL